MMNQCTARLATANAGHMARIRALLDESGYDTAQQVMRPDYFTSPFPEYKSFEARLADVETPLAVLLRLLSLAQPVENALAESALGDDAVGALLGAGLIDLDEDGTHLTTSGLSVVSWLGNYFVVSANPYYPGFDPSCGDIYMGPESLTFSAHLQRRLNDLPGQGEALDLCSGSGIAGQSLARLRPSLRWTASDLSEQASGAARFNAALNCISDRYAVRTGDLFEGLGDTRFDLIVSNPPFIPVPEGHSFPLYGSGGDDGLLVLKPMLSALPDRMAPEGKALIYAEGIVSDRLLALDACGPILASGRDVRVTILATATAEQALYALGLILSHQSPSRLSEIVAWKESFARQAVRGYCKFVIEAGPGNGRLTVQDASARPRRRS